MEDIPLRQFKDSHVFIYRLREQFPEDSEEFETLDDTLWYLEEVCMVQHNIDLERPEDAQRAVESILDEE